MFLQHIIDKALDLTSECPVKVDSQAFIEIQYNIQS